MTIEQARKFLGKDGKKLTDDEILEYINSANVLSDIFFDTWTKMTPEERKKLKQK